MSYKYASYPPAAVPVPTGRPAHSVVNKNFSQYNGFSTPLTTVFVATGSLDEIPGGSTGSVGVSFDAYGLKLLRCEVFHSGAAPSFNVNLESAYPNTGSFFDPRNVIIEYDGILGSSDFSSGIDQIENIICLTDPVGQIFIKVKPTGGGNNWFKYMLVFEAVSIYVR